MLRKARLQEKQPPGKAHLNPLAHLPSALAFSATWGFLIFPLFPL